MRPIDIPAVPTGHSAPITCVAFSAGGDRLATASYDGSVIVWDVRDPATPRPLTGLKHRRLVNAVAWNPARRGLLATASADKTAVVWEVDAAGGPGMICVLARHTDDVNSVAWLPDGRRLACVSEDGRATLWDGMTGRFLGSLVSHAAHCMMVATSREGLVATVGEDGMVAVVDPDSGAERHHGYDSSVEGCAWSRSGEWLAVARDDGHVDLLDRELSGTLSIARFSSAARSVAWRDDDRALVVGSYDGAVHFLGLDGAVLGRFHDERLWPRSVAAAGGLVGVGSFASLPYLLHQDRHTASTGPGAATHGPNAMTAHGDRLVIGCDSGAVLSVDLTAADPRASARVATPTASPVLAVDVLGEDVMFGTYAGRLGRHGGAVEVVGEQLGAPVTSVLALPDGVVAGTYNGELVVADPGTMAVRARHQAHDGSVKTLAPFDATAFVSAATDRLVTIGSATERTVLWEHGNLVNSVATVDGRVVASASRDHTVKVGRVTREPGGGWRVAGPETLIGPDESVKCVGILGTAARPVVLAGSYDFGLYAWSLAWADRPAGLRTGALVTEFGQGLSCVCRLDRGRAAVAAWDGRIAIVGVAGDTVTEITSFRVPDLIAHAAER